MDDKFVVTVQLSIQLTSRDYTVDKFSRVFDKEATMVDILCLCFFLLPLFFLSFPFFLTYLGLSSSLGFQLQSSVIYKSSGELGF